MRTLIALLALSVTPGNIQPSWQRAYNPEALNESYDAMCMTFRHWQQWMIDQGYPRHQWAIGGTTFCPGLLE